MKVKVVVIEIETPRWLKRAFAVAAPVLSIAVAGIVFATPKQWATGDALTAADLNGLAVMTGANGARYSVGATHYCGQGPSATTGAFSFNGKTGYAAGKAMCEASTDCNSSPTAHVCDGIEISRSLVLGDSVPFGWYSSFSPGYSGSAAVFECSGWSANDTAHWGATTGTLGSAVYPSSNQCNTSVKVLCCD